MKFSIFGKIVPSYRVALECEIPSWDGFKEALNSQDREAFERARSKERRVNEECL